MLCSQLRYKKLRIFGVDAGPGCCIGHRVKVSRGVVLGANVVLEDGCEVRGQVILGDGVHLQKNVEISGQVEIGDETTVSAYAFISTMPNARIRIGKRVLVNSFNIIGAGEEVLIGDDCIFAPYVQITDSSHCFEDVTDSPRHDPAYSKAVAIGRDVWLGSAVKVLMGTKIGDGAVVGAGAVVTRSLPTLAVAAGMPAKVIRFRSGSDKQGAGTTI